MQPRVSIVMAARNAANYIGEALSSIEPALGHSDLTYEVVLADGSSSVMSPPDPIAAMSMATSEPSKTFPTAPAATSASEPAQRRFGSPNSSLVWSKYSVMKTSDGSMPDLPSRVANAA